MVRRKLNQISVKNIYSAIDWDLANLEERRRSIVLGADQSAIHSIAGLYSAEVFVKKIINTDGLAFEVMHGDNGNAKTWDLPFANEFYHFNDLVSQFAPTFGSGGDYRVLRNPKSANPMLAYADDYYFDKRYQFGERVELFFRSCLSLGLRIDSFLRPEGIEPSTGRRSADIFNDLIKLVRADGRSPAFRKAIKKREEKARRNYAAYSEYVNALLLTNPNLRVFRMDLFYSEHGTRLSPEAVMKHRKTLFNNLRSKKEISRDLVGHIWTHQFSESRGHHTHAIFFFRVSAKTGDKNMVKKIGEYWIDRIAQIGSIRIGCYKTCAEDSNKFKSCGIGPINRLRSAKCRDLLMAIWYLTNKEQYLSVKLPDKYKTIGRGTMPDLSSIPKRTRTPATKIPAAPKPIRANIFGAFTIRRGLSK